MIFIRHLAHVIIVSPQSQLDLDFNFDWFGFGFGSRRTGLGTRGGGIKRNTIIHLLVTA